MTREEWLSSISSREYGRLIAWNKVEPIGTDALLIQMARVSQSMSGGRLEDILVLNTNFQQTPEEMFEMFQRLTSGDSSKS